MSTQVLGPNELVLDVSNELPFEEPTRYHLLINRKTALSLSLTIPQALLGQADELIQ